MLQASKFFMFVKWEEAAARVIVEALSKGTPVIGSARGCLPEWITTSVGYSNNDLKCVNASLRNSYDPATIYR